MRRLLCFGMWCLALGVNAQAYKSLPMWQHQLSVEERVQDLVSRLTLEEKAAQMLNAAPAIPRLGIPAYDWWNEVLHGVARTPFKTTVFPQAIGMAATWDTSSIQQMAYFAALEGRAVFNKANQLGRGHERYLGLTYWTPNINIFRDPRWGRGQETYGEDPYLTGKMGAAFVRGLQGNHPNYLLAAACAKHYAVHSGPEPSRHSDNFNVTDYELWDTYLPAFKELVVNANVAGVMCAYNAFRTQPCCANDLLMQDILRKRWKFDGYVTSDCWALDDFFRYHKTHTDATHAAVDALVHGTDVECGKSVYSTLVEAVRSGKIAESQIDQSVKRLFTIRYRLGMFDPRELVPFANAGDEMLEAAPHTRHALHMARQSIVLLKNDKQLLPLSKHIKKIAVVGPNAHNAISVLGNYNGTPSVIKTIWDGIREKSGDTMNLMYEPAIDFTTDTLFRPDAEQGMQGALFDAAFFNNETLEGKPVFTTKLPGVAFYLSEGQAPFPAVPATHYSARFSTRFVAMHNETIVWQLEGDDGYRLWINDSMVVNAWNRNRWGAKTFELKAEKGKSYNIVLEYWQSEGNASIKMIRGKFVKTDMQQLAAKLSSADVIIFAGGISPQLEGEEMPVNYPGFDGGDRNSILLPAVQTRLMQHLKATGKPVVFVMMTGSAIATPWESEHVDAIVNAWYGGQAAGTAVADVLFGDYNPAGRLPVTFYKSDADLPPFKDYSVTGRTYRYFKGEVLYPFGYGLSYTQFSYQAFNTPGLMAKGDSLKINAIVSNIGNADGEEVVQCYVHFPEYKGQAPIRALKGFQRIFLKKGEQSTITFELKPEDVMLTDARGDYFFPEGTVKIYIGGGQPDVKMPGVATGIHYTIHLKK